MRKRDLDAIYGNVCQKCGGIHRAVVNETVPDHLQKQAELIAKGLYNGTITEGSIDPVMTKLVAEELRKAVIQGFGKDLPDLSYGTPDYKMLAALEKNVYQFAGAENYQMLKSINLAMVDENGQLREFRDFKVEATKVAGVYLGRNLSTEFTTAIGSSQMAAKWVEIEANKETAPWLRYDTVGDSKVRPEHKKLNGIIKRVDDNFWLLWFPPNGWLCRCDVTQLLSGADTAADSIQFPNDTPDMFKTNLAKDGLIYPAGHPYYVGVPDAVLRKAAALRTPMYSQAYPLSGKTKTGGRVEISSMADQNDLTVNLQHATVMADLGEKVRIRPHIEGGKNPELELINGTQTGDFKEPAPKSNPKNSYEHQIQSAARQGANITVLVFNETNYHPAELVRALNNKKLWEKAKGVTEVWLLFGRDLVKITREEIDLKTYFSKLPE